MIPLNILRKVFNDDRIITGTIDNLVAFIILLTYTIYHIVREEDIAENKSTNEIGLNHQTLVIIDLVRYAQLIKDINDTL